jgi:hypothetical protein
MRARACGDDQLDTCEARLVADAVEKCGIARRALNPVASSQHPFPPPDGCSASQQNRPAAKEEIRFEAGGPAQMRAHRHEEWTESKAAKTGSHCRPLARGATIAEIGRGEDRDILAAKLQERVPGARV